MQGMAKTVSKKIKVREFIFSNCKTYFKAALFKTIKNTKKKKRHKTIKNTKTWWLNNTLLNSQQITEEIQK